MTCSIEEGLSMVQLQAMACGLPVICTANSGGKEIINDNINGYILPIRNKDLLREKYYIFIIIDIFVNKWEKTLKKSNYRIFLGNLWTKSNFNISRFNKLMKKIIITGGCGFIGSHIVEHFFYKYKKSNIVVLDKITYAANINNLINIKKSKRLKIIKKDILDLKILKKITKKADLVIHAAAESHVDNSFQLNDDFILTNVLGTKNVMQACKENKVKKILHISTDEIYGEIFRGSFNETDKFNPSNPYSSSKAAAEMIVNGYIHSYKLPVIIVRANNILE